MFIADDSLYRRDRSKHVELLARVHDHTTNRYHRGFRKLTLGWSDGHSFVPLMISMLSPPQQKNRLTPMNQEVDKRTVGYRRRLESLRKAPDLLVSLGADDHGAPIQAKIVFLRDRRDSKKWPAVISTDTTLTAQEIITLYRRRWNIEDGQVVSGAGHGISKPFLRCRRSAGDLGLLSLSHAGI